MVARLLIRDWPASVVFSTVGFPPSRRGGSVQISKQSVGLMFVQLSSPKVATHTRKREPSMRRDSRRWRRNQRTGAERREHLQGQGMEPTVSPRLPAGTIVSAVGICILERSRNGNTFLYERG